MSLVEKIQKLKKEKNAVILAHFYQSAEIQDIADFVGDSLDLSKKAKEVDADIIVFCGVTFMAEVAKILNPKSKVLVPDMAAGCSLEDSCPPDEFAAFCQQHPDHKVISYINCSAEIKALSDIIVTSSNAERIVNSFPKNQKIIFAPDKHLGSYINKITGRNMKLWDGSCIVHENFSYKSLIKLKERHQKAKIIAHPECPENLLAEADFVGSTIRLIDFVEREKEIKDFIILTEPHIIHKMQQTRPNANFYAVEGVDKENAECTLCNNCPYMELNDLEKVLEALEGEHNEIVLEDSLMLKAKESLDMMLRV